MGEIVFARVDDRLIHGQIMVRWARGFNCNSVFVVDDDVAKDPLMKTVYSMSPGTSGLTVKIFSIQEVVDYWKKTGFEEYKLILLVKSIPVAKKIIDEGIPIKKLNIGGISKKPGTKSIIESVSISEDEAEILKKINKDYGIEVFFQMVPDSRYVNLTDALKLFKDKNS
jgi:PTS system mannose-specific IIB component